MIIDNDLLSIQQARILAENAAQAHKVLAAFDQDRLDAIVEAMAEAVTPHLQALAVMSQAETDWGYWQDKLVKNRFVCTQVRQRLQGLRCVGVIAEDRQHRILDIGVPVGVIVALCPATSPVSTTISTALIAVKSGNSVIFAPHPRAMKSMGRVLDLLIDAALSHGLPEGCLSYLQTVTKSGTQELMTHPAASLIMMTGVPSLLSAAQATGKPLIYGGTGHGPAFIERTADIDQAVADIVTSKTFDHGMASSAEQSLVVEACVADRVVEALLRQGAYFMSEEEAQCLASQLFCPNGRPSPGLVGIPAAVLARRAGFSVPDTTTVLITRRTYVSETDPYSREMLSPVLAMYEEDDWRNACEKCIELLLHEKRAHTLVIHSNDPDVIRQFALKKPVARLLVNTPAIFGGMGATTNLFPSMTLGSGSVGLGITADNVSPFNLVYVRKVGYGLRSMPDAPACLSDTARIVADVPHGPQPPELLALQQVLQKAIQVLEGPANREKTTRN